MENQLQMIMQGIKELQGDLKRVEIKVDGLEKKLDDFQKQNQQEHENIIDHIANKFGKYDYEISTLKKAIANK